MQNDHALVYAVIGPSLIGKITNKLIKEFEKRNIPIMKLTPKDFGVGNINQSNITIIFGKESTKFPDIAIVRGVGSQIPSQIFYRLDWMWILEREGVNLINSRSCLEIATNKMLTTQVLTKKQIPNPETIMCESCDLAMKAFDRLNQDIVLKPLYGARGRGVARITNPRLAETLFKELEQMNDIFYIQRYMEHNNEDVRILVVGDKVLCSMKRKAKSWKTNITKGAIPFKYEPSQQDKELALEAARSVGGEIIGVDLMETAEGPMIIEVNAVPGYEGLQSITDFDINEKIVDYVIQRGKYNEL